MPNWNQECRRKIREMSVKDEEEGTGGSRESLQTMLSVRVLWKESGKEDDQGGGALHCSAVPRKSCVGWRDLLEQSCLFEGVP